MDRASRPGGADRHAFGRVVVVDNASTDDSEVAPGWLAALVTPFADPQAAATSNRPVLPDGRLNSTGGLIGPSGYGRDRGFGEPDDGRFAGDVDVLCACGPAMALRVEAVHTVGSTERRFFMYDEGAELCWRLRLAGWSVRLQS